MSVAELEPTNLLSSNTSRGAGRPKPKLQCVLRPIAHSRMSSSVWRFSAISRASFARSRSSRHLMVSKLRRLPPQRNVDVFGACFSPHRVSLRVTINSGVMGHAYEHHRAHPSDSNCRRTPAPLPYTEHNAAELREYATALSAS